MFDLPILLSVGAIIGIIIAAVFVILIIAVIWLLWSKYNQLVKARNKVKNSWSQIDVQLQRRFDLIPNLAETVKGYAKHEESILGDFAKARSLYDRAKASNDVKGMATADNMLTQTLGSLMMVNERYPELKADAQFIQLSADLKETENKVSYTRQFYNDVVLTYNNLREVFPTIIIANMFGFKAEEFFKVDSEEVKKAPKVSFTDDKPTETK